MKKGVERRNGLKRLKNLGSFQHNVDILKQGYGELVVVRRSPRNCHAASYLPCPKCLGFFYKYDLWRHSCPGSTTQDSEQKQTGLITQSRSLLDGALDDGKEVDKDLKKYVLERMRRDKHYNVIKRDELILKFGSSQLKRIGVRGRRRISSRMRLLSKLLKKLQKVLEMPDKPLSHFLDGCYFDSVMQSVCRTVSWSRLNMVTECLQNQQL